jgi:hypothetical protein
MHVLFTALIFISFHWVADADDPLKTTDQTRRLGLIVCFLLILVILFKHSQEGSSFIRSRTGEYVLKFIVTRGVVGLQMNRLTLDDIGSIEIKRRMFHFCYRFAGELL